MSLTRRALLATPAVLAVDAKVPVGVPIGNVAFYPRLVNDGFYDDSSVLQWRLISVTAHDDNSECVVRLNG